MKVIVLVSTLLFLSSLCSSLKAEDGWHSGVVVLKNHEVINGELKHDWRHNVIQVKRDDRTEAYSAFQVALFYFHDERLKAVRKYVSLPYEARPHAFVDVFFEEVVRGEISMLRKENPGYNWNQQAPDRDIYTPSGKIIDDYNYHYALSFDYFYSVKGRLMPMEDFREEFMASLSHTEVDRINHFIAENSIDLSKVADQVRVIRFYNKSRPSSQSISLETL